MFCLKKQVQVVIQESLIEYLLYTKYRLEPETNVTTLHLLGFHIYEEKSSDKIGKQTKMLLRTELCKRENVSQIRKKSQKINILFKGENSGS